MKMPKGARGLEENDPRSKDVIGLVNLMMTALENYILHHDSPAIAMQDSAVAAAHMAGLLYGKMAILGYIHPPIEDLVTVNSHNFRSGFDWGFKEAAKILIDAARDGLIVSD